jgi:hypothetical protein
MIKDAAKNDWYEIEAMAKANNRRLRRAKLIFIAMALMIYIIIILNNAL